MDRVTLDTNAYYNNLYDCECETGAETGGDRCEACKYAGLTMGEIENDY